MPWTTPTAPGHYCIQVLLEPADDSNPQSNLGQENTNVGKAQSPAVLILTLRHNTKKQQTYNFALDSYVPGAPDPCAPPVPLPSARRDWPAIDAACSRFHPAGKSPWRPATPTLDPDQSTSITVTDSPPPGLLGNQVLNLNAFHANGMAPAA